jgi:hypothetical protein
MCFGQFQSNETTSMKNNRSTMPRVSGSASCATCSEPPFLLDALAQMKQLNRLAAGRTLFPEAGYGRRALFPPGLTESG